MSSPPEPSVPPAGTSRTVTLPGPDGPQPVHVVDFGGAADGPTVVLVHGLGGSHLNWDLLAPLLTPHARVVALDLPGFGFSAPPRRPATIGATVGVLTRFVREIGPVVLVGNSMGGMVSLLLAARTPELVDRIVLLDPALLAPARLLRSPADTATIAMHALPGIGERVRRRRRERIGAHATLAETLQRCGLTREELGPELYARTVALVEGQSAGMDRAYLSACRSLAWVLARPRTYRAAMSAVTAPVLMLHGDRDELVPVGAARTAARQQPSWRYVELAGVGHLPQLQVPHVVAGHVLGWIGARVG